MFEPHFGLRENPFSTSHDPRFVYPSPEHLEAVAHFRYGIQNREAFVLVTGEVGTGKTTAIYDLVSRLPQQSHVALINNSALTRIELLEEIARRFRVEAPAGISKPGLLSALEGRLSVHVAAGESSILIVDEAQNLDHELLEEIRLLSNLEDARGHLLHICLVGQSELEDKLARPELRQLRQRISVKYRLKPLTPEECVRYVHHRLRVAGGLPEEVFPAESCHAVHRLTHGIPREINIVASQAMVNAYADGARIVRLDHVGAVSDEFAFKSVLGGPAPPPASEARAAADPEPTAPQPPAPAPTPSVAARPAIPPVPAMSAVPPMATGAPAAASARPHAAPPELSVVGPASAPAHPAVPAAAPQPSVQSPAPQTRTAAVRRTVSNWRDRPSQPLPAMRGSAALEHAPDLENEDGEESPAGRRRILALGSLAAAVLVIGVVVLAGGIGGRLPGGGKVAETPKAPPAAPRTQEPPQTASAGSGAGAVRSSGKAPPGESAAGAARNRASDAVPAAPTAAPTAVPHAPPAAAASPVPAVETYGLRVASFSAQHTAERALKDLEATTGLDGRVVQSEMDGGTWYTIVLGSFADSTSAETRAQDLLARSLIAEATVTRTQP